METSLEQRVLEQAIAIQQIPAPTFKETERALFLQERFKQEGLKYVQMDQAGNVYACLPGSGQGQPLVISAHTDTVFPASTNLATQIKQGEICGPGIGDNSLGVAALFGLCWALQQRQAPLDGDIWLVANVCEEGLGNLRGMQAVVQRFKAEVRAYLILEGMALGQIYHRGLGVQRYRITAHTAGGHSWVDFGRPSAIHELAALVTRLTEIPISHNPRTSLNVGVISGGTTVNTIAAEAMLELDLRSESERTLNNLVDRVLNLVAAANHPGVSMSAELIGNRPAGKISADHPLVTLAKGCLEKQGISAHLNIGSTDANIPLSQGLPAVCIGLTTGQGAHTIRESIQTEPLKRGLAQLIDLVDVVFSRL